MRVQGKVKVRSRQRKHNLNSSNNLMGFDTIEINLVYILFGKTEFWAYNSAHTYSYMKNMMGMKYHISVILEAFELSVVSQRRDTS